MATIRRTSTLNIKPTTISTVHYAGKVTVESGPVYGEVIYGEEIYGGGTVTSSIGQVMPKISTREI